MKYYATVATSSQKCQHTVERIERRVLDSNPIMEAFGEGEDDSKMEGKGKMRCTVAVICLYIYHAESAKNADHKNCVLFFYLVPP